MTTKRQQGYRVTLSYWVPVDPRSVTDTIEKSETVRDLLSGVYAPSGCQVEADKSRSLWTSRTPPLGLKLTEPMSAEEAIAARSTTDDPAEDEPATVTRLRATA